MNPLARRRKNGTITAITPMSPLPAGEKGPMKMRIRMSDPERQLIIQALAAQLPKTVKKALREQRWWHLSWRVQRPWNDHRLLLRRLETVRRGRPATR